MYVPKIYQNPDLNEVHEFIRQNGFAILVNQTLGKFWATHIPLILSQNEKGADILTGHLSKANPQGKEFQQNDTVMAIFSGPHAYISSSWYDHENVPTWNYIAVHVYGKIRILEGDALRKSLKSLVDKYEAYSPNPVSIEKMSPQYLESHIKGITAFEIEIESIEPAYKLSQNRDAKNHQNIIRELEKREAEGSAGVAKEMRKRAK